jgi:hypothetical protein
MKTISKALVGTVAAGAMAMTSATPAMAQYRDRDDGIDAGDIIAGAVILGGIAAVAAAVGNNDRDYRYDDYRYDNNYRYDARGYGYGYGQRYGNPRQAVEQCVRTVENEARRYGYRMANVTQIRDVDDQRNGWRVRGNLVVDSGYGQYNNRWGNGGWGNDRYRGSDSGTFTCRVDRGRVYDVDFNGIRGLR